MAQRVKPWDANEKDPAKQERYLGHEHCLYYEAFGEYNKLKIVRLVKTKCGDEEEGQELFQHVMEEVEALILPHIEPGNFGAVNTEDPDADGFYLVRWTGHPCYVQKDTKCDNNDIAPKNTLVCEGTYWNLAGGVKQWYTPPVDKDLNPVNNVVKLRVQHVLCPQLDMEDYGSADVALPANTSKKIKEYVETTKGKRVSDESYYEIERMIERREYCDYHEDREQHQGMAAVDGEDDSDDEDSDEGSVEDMDVDSDSDDDN